MVKKIDLNFHERAKRILKTANKKLNSAKKKSDALQTKLKEEYKQANKVFLEQGYFMPEPYPKELKKLTETIRKNKSTIGKFNKYFLKREVLSAIGSKLKLNIDELSERYFIGSIREKPNSYGRVLLSRTAIYTSLLNGTLKKWIDNCVKDNRQLIIRADFTVDGHNIIDNFYTVSFDKRAISKFQSLYDPRTYAKKNVNINQEIKREFNEILNRYYVGKDKLKSQSREYSARKLLENLGFVIKKH